MIRTDAELRQARARLVAEEDRLTNLHANLKSKGLTPSEIKRALDPLTSFHLQLTEEVKAYESLRRGEFNNLANLHGLGRLLIALRIFRGISQRELAQRLGVHESQVSRDERNEYHGITVNRAGRILDVLGARLSSMVELQDVSQ